MKKINDLHYKIDVLSCFLFLYFAGVLLLLLILQFVDNDIIRVLLSLFLSTLLCRRRIVFALNHFLHVIFNLRE